MMPYDDIKSLLKKRLTEKRRYHSLCVADAARHLAEKIRCRCRQNVPCRTAA